MKDRIRQIMEAQHMTQQEFAEFIGTTPATLSGIFNDRTRPTINIVEAIKKRIPAINTDWLLFGNGTMFKAAEGADLTGKPSGASTNVGAGGDGTPARQREGSLFDQSQMIDFGGGAAGGGAGGGAAGGQMMGGQIGGGAVGGSAVAGGQQVPPYYHNARTGRVDPTREAETSRVVVERAHRRVTEIRVYYDDQTWESFVPSKK